MAKKQKIKEPDNLTNSIIKSIKKAWHLALHPSKATPMSIMDSIKFYYSFAVVPFIITLIITVASSFTYASTTASVFILVSILTEIVGFIISPIGFLIAAAIYHFFGKFLFGKFKKDYSVTVTAAVIGTIPTMLFAFIQPIYGLVIGNALLTSASSTLALSIAALLPEIILGIWGIVIIILAFIKLQKVSGVVATLTWLVPTVIIFILVILLLYLALSVTNSLPTSTLTTI